MKNKFLLTIIAMLQIIALSSCNKFEGEQEIPSYIRVKGFQMTDNPQLQYQQGEDFLTNEISEVWVSYFDNHEEKNLGAYSLRSDSNLVIPILAKGKHKITLRPGIKYNGMAATREYYRFYTEASDTIDLQEGKITDIDVQQVMYNTSAELSMRYFFEESYNPFENEPSASGSNPNFRIISGDSVAYGQHCGAMYSCSSSDSYRILTKDSVSSNRHAAMILELDYHANIPFEVGIYSHTYNQSSYYFVSSLRVLPNHNSSYSANDKRNWKKMYIILGRVWGQVSYNPFKIYLQPFNTSNRPDGFVHIDNIKVIHYPD